MSSVEKGELLRFMMKILSVYGQIVIPLFPLDKRFQKKMEISYKQRLIIMQGCARALHYLHTVAEKSIIHGDVKLANILLDKHLEAKLGDFGLCRDSFTRVCITV